MVLVIFCKFGAQKTSYFKENWLSVFFNIIISLLIIKVEHLGFCIAISWLYSTNCRRNRLSLNSLKLLFNYLFLNIAIIDSFFINEFKFETVSSAIWRGSQLILISKFPTIYLQIWKRNKDVENSFFIKIIHFHASNGKIDTNNKVIKLRLPHLRKIS